MKTSGIRIASLLLICTAASFAHGAQSDCIVHDSTLVDAGALDMDRLGESSALDGGTLILGAPAFLAGTPPPGKAVVFVESGGSWIQQATLTASDGHSGNGFGDSVDIEGDLAIVGSPRYDGTHFNQGAAYVFERSGSTWTEVARLVAPGGDSASSAFLGRSVAIDGETLIVGSPGWRNEHEYLVGRVDIFEREAGSWNLKYTSVPNFEPFQLGGAVDLHGDRAVAGATNAALDDPVAQGVVHVFARSAGVWAFEDSLSAPFVNDTSDWFGRSVALQDGRVVVGAPRGNSPGQHIGEVHVFERVGSAWTPEQVLTAFDQVNHNDFGESVALDEDRIFVGAPSHQHVNGVFGAAYLFVDTGSAWMESDAFYEPTSGNGGFGSSVELEADWLTMGVPSRLTVGGRTGVAEVYRELPSPEVHCIAKINSQGCTPIIHSSGIPSASSSRSFSIRASGLINNKTGLFFYGLEGRNSVPFQGGTLCVQPSLQRTLTQSTGGLAGPDDCSGGLAIDFNALIRSGVDARLVPGVTVNGQFFYRDPQSAIPVGLTEGIEWHICP